MEGIRVRAGVIELVDDLGFVCNESRKGQGLSEVERVGDPNRCMDLKYCEVSLI